MRRRMSTIGDVHGCSRALEVLLDAIDPGEADQIVTLGDYVNRGPDSRGVLDHLIVLERHCTLIPLLGNHDEMFLEALTSAGTGHSHALSSWLWMGGDATLASYGISTGDTSGVRSTNIPAEHRAFLERCYAYHETDTHIFLHANYDPALTLDDQPLEPLRWESLRDGIPGPHRAGKRVITGRTAQKSGKVLHLGHIVCVDTYCYGGGWLTAYDVHTEEIWQTNRLGEVRSPRPQ
jgi:serine/threonine protein phosphatase 1